MGIGITIITALALGIIAAGIITIIVLSIKKLKELLKSRLGCYNKSKVAFGSTRKIINEHAKEILENAPTMTMSELEDMADESPYLMVDYDPDTDEITNYVVIQPEKVDTKVNELFEDNDGIVLFD